LGYNLFGNSSGGSGYTDTDLLDVDPLLGPLQDNGGPTLTHALLPGSPAIGAGDKTGHPRWDQRGRPYRRVVHGRMDIGAFEVQSDGSSLSAPGISRGEGPILAALVSGLPLPTDPLALWSAAPFPGPAATRSLTRGLVSIPEGPSDPRAVSVDQWFASLAEEAQGKMAARWPDREPVKPVRSNPDLVPEEAGLAL
jgi:hypothetical protein